MIVSVVSFLIVHLAPGEPSQIDPAAAGDLGPDSIVVIAAADSPIGAPLLAVGNEVSGTTTLYRVDIIPTGASSN